MHVLGLDIGHSAVKLALSGTTGAPTRVMFPSMVSPAVPIADEPERLRAAAETVALNERRYFFGDTAQIQSAGRGPTGLNEKWIFSQEHTVLLLGAWRVAERALGETLRDPMLVLGLPTHLFATQRNALKQIVTQHLPVASDNLKVMPQSMAPYQRVMLRPDGTPDPARTMGGESWAVVEVGHYTTDLCLVNRGRWVEPASGACAGVAPAAERLVRLLRERDISINLADAQATLATGHVKHFGSRIDVTGDCARALEGVAAEIIDTAARLFEPWVQALDGVVIAGGGAGLVYEALKSKWPHCLLPADPRFAVAEGMRRFGAAFSSVRRLAAVSG